MKKTLPLIILLLLIFTPYIFATPNYEGEQKIYGHVDTECFLDVNLDTTLPFNLLDNKIQNREESEPEYPSSLDGTTGLRIGSWSIRSNTSAFNIFITCNPLTNSSSQEVKYALFFYVNNNAQALCVTSNKSKTGFKFEDTTSSNYSSFNQNIYIKLLTPKQTIDNYKDGLYTATFTITMESI